jgi:DNA mismatch endonuclease (patch repair protein)
VPNAAPSSPHATATMRANRGRDTAPELALRAALHRRGLRFYKDRRVVLRPGWQVRPDIVFPRLHVAVFVDGCYWHGCTTHRTIPVSNSEFWTTKIEGTRKRDAEQTKWLKAAGWTVLRIWEHEDTDDAVARVTDAVSLMERRIAA